MDLTILDWPTMAARAKARFASPVGWSAFEITGAVFRPNSKGTGNFIAVTFSGTGDANRGKRITGYFNVEHSNSWVVDQGVGALNSLCHAIGINPSDLGSGYQHLSALTGRAVQAEVKNRDYNGTTQSYPNAYRSIHAMPEGPPALDIDSDDLPF